MNDSKLVPSFRFVEFKEGYTKNNLKELASFLKGKGYSKNDIVNYGFPIILYGRMYTNYRLNIKFINDTFVKNDKNSVKSVEGDVIIPASGETAEDISIASNIKRSGIIIGGDINIIRPDNKLIDSSFLALVLSNGKVKQQIAKRAQGKSIVHIHNTDLMSLKIYFPSLNEQQKIGDFFSKLDKLLDLQQQKIDKLELLKKALLQKLFPKHDAQIPELRFKGFEDDWQEKKLSHVVDIIMGQSPSSTNYYDTPIENSMILIQGNADIKHHNVKPRIWTTQITKIAIPKDVLLTVRAPVGEVAKNKYEAVIGRGMAALRGNDFLYYNLEKLKEVGYWERLSTGSTFESISSNDIRDTKIKIPSCKEQKKVYNLLSKVDQLIELENQKLQNFQQVKKCLLQNMFVE